MPVREDLEFHYRMLEVPWGASLDDVKASWRDLVKIWHPDRFANDPRLQQKCQEKLKHINESYEVLRAHLTSGEEAAVPFTPQQGVTYGRCAGCGEAIRRDEVFCEACELRFSRAGYPTDTKPKGPRKKLLTPVNVVLFLSACWFASRSFDEHGAIGPNQIFLFLVIVIIVLRFI